MVSGEHSAYTGPADEGVPTPLPSDAQTPVGGVSVAASPDSEPYPGGSERPVPTAPARRDALWVAIRSLGESVVGLNKRVGAVEAQSRDAHAMAVEAISKVNAITLAQIETQKTFTEAINRNTRAFEDVNTTVKSAKWFGVAIVGVMGLMLVALIALLLATFAR